MITFLLITLSFPFLLGHPVKPDQACQTLKRFEESLKSALELGDANLCLKAQPNTEFTAASLEIVKKCLEGVEINSKCFHEEYKSLSENQAFFCGGILKYFEMLTSVKALLCEEGQGRESRLFFPDALAGLNDLLGFANADQPKPTAATSTTVNASSTTTAASSTTAAPTTTTASSMTTTKKPDFHWCYIDESCGEEAWKVQYPTCAGQKQSPINVDFASNTATEEHPTGGALLFTGYDKVKTSFTITEECVKCNEPRDLKNNGHTAQFDVLMPAGDDEGILRGGPLSEKYQILQFHWHWGSDDTKGSEHTYDGKAFPLEMHVVHVKSSLKDDLTTALSTSDGLAVAGFQFEIGSEDNAALKPLTESLEKITSSGAKFDVTGFKLNDLIAPATATDTRYSTYDGGLTTPSCNEVVKWINLMTPLKISSAQLKLFRTLIDGKDKNIVDNFRSPQPLNGRTVGHFLVEARFK